ncbi:MAG TPA: hypothetical protein PLJ44_11305, partial [Victivallales bacterium]|nr:hypothetical protein [Victivallales bacterium]
FAILTRGNIWFFTPGIAIFAFISGIKKNLSRGLIFSIIFTIIVIIPQLPFAYWNYLKTSKFKGASTAAEAVLGLGNTPEAPPGGRNPGFGPGPMEYPETYMEWASQQKISERIIEWAFSEPLAFLELQFRKLLLFWDYREIPNNIAFEYNGQKSIIWKTFALIRTSILITLALSWIFFHFFLIFKRKKSALKKFFNYPLLLNIYFILAYWLATAAFYNLERFRVPSLPLFAIFAGFFICDFCKIFIYKNKAEYYKLKFLLISIFISVFIVFFSYDCYRFYEPSIMRFIRPDGTKVKLNEEKTLILDNGPFTFGGWELIALKEGDEILKKFSIPFQAGCVAKFSFEIYFLTSGKVVLEVNGIEKEISSDHEGKVEKIISLENLPAPEINIKIKTLDAKILTVIDTQRNYLRTFINKKNPGGELVSRLYIIGKPLK